MFGTRVLAVAKEKLTGRTLKSLRSDSMTISMDWYSESINNSCHYTVKTSNRN